LLNRVRQVARGPVLKLSGAFDVIAELKLRSPAYGALGASTDDVEARVGAYARGGAVMVSVLTEPSRFDGDLSHLCRASETLTAVGVPTLRKDFIVDPYQLLEAVSAGASGVLLITRMLSEAQLSELLAVAASLSLFVILETFDRQDIEVATALACQWQGAADQCLLGINSRDLSTLKVVPERLGQLVQYLPITHPRVAESGLQTAQDAAVLAAAGYQVALVGSALMTAVDPSQLLADMIAAGRAACQVTE
jgi:indole-3-glycerol phosphate synthase